MVLFLRLPLSSCVVSETCTTDWRAVWRHTSRANCWLHCSQCVHTHNTHCHYDILNALVFCIWSVWILSTSSHAVWIPCNSMCVCDASTRSTSSGSPHNALRSLVYKWLWSRLSVTVVFCEIHVQTQSSKTQRPTCSLCKVHEGKFVWKSDYLTKLAKRPILCSGTLTTALGWRRANDSTLSMALPW